MVNCSNTLIAIRQWQDQITHRSKMRAVSLRTVVSQDNDEEIRT